MQVYSCGNCGYVLPGPVGQCPRCHALLRGEREGGEEERQRRESAYRRNTPEARARREKLEMLGSTVGGFLLILLVIAIFVGGGAALGWFVLPHFFGREAIIPLTVGGALLGGTLLFGIAQWFINTVNLYSPFRSPEKPWEEAERNYRSKVGWWSVLFCFVLVPILGIAGWIISEHKLDHITFYADGVKNSVSGIAVIGGIAGGVAVVYLITPLAKRFLGLSVSNLLDFELWPSLVYGIPFLVGVVCIGGALGFVFDKQNIASSFGMIAALPLAYYWAKHLAGPPPDTFKMRREVLLQAVIQNPASISDLDRWDREVVLLELQQLVQAAPDAWKFLPPDLQQLVPSPQSSAQVDSGKEKKSSRRGTKSPKKNNMQT